MMFYIKSNGKIYGPTDEEKIKFYVKSGFFSLSSQTSTDLQKWQPLDLGRKMKFRIPRDVPQKLRPLRLARENFP